MNAADETSRQALAARIAQRLAEPSQNILGFQTLIVETLRNAGLPEAMADAERVLKAARDLEAMITSLLATENETALVVLDDATLRHDLRTPVNGIVGFSELILEEYGDALDRSLKADITSVLKECERVLGLVDGLVEFSHGSVDAVAVDASDAGIAADLARTLAKAPDPTYGKVGRVLVIDDMEVNRELLRRNLQSRGHLVSTVASASEALALLETTRFELALVDILMPDMNGIELLARLKSDPRWSEMAVVMVSGLKDVQAVVKCIKAGAADYLQKPLDPVLLHARVETCLENVRWRERERQFLEKIEFEKSRADGLLLSMLPETIIRRLGEGETLIADRFEAATIVFADIVDFTPLVARTDPSSLVGHLHDLFCKFDDLADRHGVEKIKTIGDAYMAVAGVPEPRSDHAVCALAFARALLGVEAKTLDSAESLKIRIGVSSGPVIAGLIGRKRFVYDVWGETVNLASRLESSGEAGRIHLSEATMGALGGTPQQTCATEKIIKGIGRVRTFVID